MHRPDFDVDVHVNNEGWYSAYKAVTEIAPSAFASSAIAALDILPKTTTSNSTDIQLKVIGANAFQGCAALKVLTIPDVDIDSTAFTGSALEEVTIFKRIIPVELFQGITTLEKVDLREGVTNIGARAFRNCSSLTELIIPSTVTVIGTNAFDGCTGLRILRSAINIDNIFTSTQIVTNLSNLQELHLVGNRVTGILDTHPFTDITSLTTVNLSSSVTNIGANAFNGCTSLANVTMPGVINIRDYAFRRCTSLVTVTLPTSLRTIGEYAFENCTSLTAASLPNLVTTIGRNAFNGCTLLANIALNGTNVIPNSVTSIGDSAYAGTGITRVTIPNNLTAINDNMFNGCASLATVIFQATSRVNRIGKNAFQGCTSLGNLAIPLSVATIDEEAFIGCSGLRSVSVVDGSNSLRTINARAFSGCTSDETIIIIPALVNTVGASAFNGFKGNLIILGKMNPNASQDVPDSEHLRTDSAWGAGWRTGIDPAANVQYL
jgi:hypothetical protein